MYRSRRNQIGGTGWWRHCTGAPQSRHGAIEQRMMILLQAILSKSIIPGDLRVPHGYQIRTSHSDDIDELGRLYFAAYDPDVGCASEAEAIDDIRKSFTGDYGELWIEASPVIIHDGAIVGVVQTVVSAPWTDVPPGPFITECFVDREHRRLGLAQTMLNSAITSIIDSGSHTVSLRVMASNSPARLLYASLGFRQGQ